MLGPYWGRTGAVLGSTGSGALPGRVGLCCNTMRCPCTAAAVPLRPPSGPPRPRQLQGPRGEGLLRGLQGLRSFCGPPKGLQVQGLPDLQEGRATRAAAGRPRHASRGACEVGHSPPCSARVSCGTAHPAGAVPRPLNLTFAVASPGPPRAFLGPETGCCIAIPVFCTMSVGAGAGPTCGVAASRHRATSAAQTGCPRGARLPTGGHPHDAVVRVTDAVGVRTA